jgi:hypothetical protein
VTFRPTLRHTLDVFYDHIRSCDRCGGFIRGTGGLCQQGELIIGELKLVYSGPLKPLSVTGR